MTNRLAAAALAAAAALPGALAAQGPADALAGYSPAHAARQRALESAAIARPAPDSAERHSRTLAREPHVAGTEAQARTRDYVIAEMRRYGLATETRGYEVYLPHATAVRAWRLGVGARGDSAELDLAEGPVGGDTTSYMPQYPTVNGSSAPGDVAAEVVYVNYGLIEDYARLDSLGVSVRGKIAVARYGRSFRGIKAREAEKNGAAALVIYSDPADDGFARGDVYPEGPMRAPQGVQRGSVFNGDGDPSTPGYPSVKGARRVAAGRMELPKIPVIPMSYGNAAELLRDVRGAKIPAQEWQGGLPFRYHVGPGPVRARLHVATDVATRAYKTIWNTYGTIRGSDFPNEIVVIGAHRDGWGPGAADNVSGTVSVLEAARAVAAEAKAGRPPRRTVVFATWDAEEWGLIGSTEYVEQDSLRLARGAVAYLNQDVAAQGPDFGAGGSPSLRATVRSVARLVADPETKTSVYAAWRRAERVAADSEPAFGDPGGGSDFAPFYNHLGVPIAEWGFGGPGGVYHSAYDSYSWMAKFGDPGFRYHAAAARIGAALVLRMANADVLPYDYAEFARTMRGYLPAVDSSAAARRLAGVSTAPVRAALDRFEQAGVRFAARRDAALARELPKATLVRANAALLRVERALTRPQGLRTRPWNRNLIYAADEDNGYANIPLPSVNEAVRANDRVLAQREIVDLAARFDQAAKALADAGAALGER
jgi:N-acetylated-alpha-linked acidic dipeptidase